MAITHERCEEIVSWSRRLYIPAVKNVQIKVDYEQPEGHPNLDSDNRLLKLHPADYRALQRYDDLYSRSTYFFDESIA